LDHLSSTLTLFFGDLDGEQRYVMLFVRGLLVHSNARRQAAIAPQSERRKAYFVWRGLLAFARSFSSLLGPFFHQRLGRFFLSVFFLIQTLAHLIAPSKRNYFYYTPKG
jgi:hypothetical protein